MNEDIAKVIIYVGLELLKLFSIYMFIKSYVKKAQVENSEELLKFIEAQGKLDIELYEEIEKLKKGE